MHSEVLTVEEVRDAERQAMSSGTDPYELMCRAGEGAAHWIWRVMAGRSIAILCGPGNNGGDGYVIAESLRGKGARVTVIAPEEPKTDAGKTACAAFHGAVSNELDHDVGVAVDCLFGYGLSRDITGAYADLLGEIARHDCTRIAIDVPSGIAADSGQICGQVPFFDLTLALGAWKRAHFLMPARERMGTLRAVSIGLAPGRASGRISSRPRIARPASGTHKYARGLLAIVAGEMPGAPLLAAEAAMRSGAGYVRLLSEHSHPDAPAELVIQQGALRDGLADPRINASLIGPGLGRGEEARNKLVCALETGKPCVLDADALHILDSDLLEGCDAAKFVVTPHEGELAALCRTFGIQGETKFERASNLHRETGMTVLAKGADTLLFSEDGAVFFPPASTWLSAAGTGDVLAGIVASRLAHHGDGARASEEAVCLHSEAARLASPAFTAGELARTVGSAVARFL